MSTSSVTTFSDATKVRVRQLMSQKCWLCSSCEFDHCHVIPKAARHELLELVELNIIEFASLADLANAILLCPTCHRAFDSSVPSLIIVPSDIAFFIAEEDRDYRRRCSLYERETQEHQLQRQFHPSASVLAPTPQFPSRIAVTASQYATTTADRSARPPNNTRTPSYGQYDAYLTRDFLSHIPPRPDYPRGTKIISAKEWHGSPTAMMWKSSAILQHRFGMPLDVIRLLSEWQTKCSEHEFPPPPPPNIPKPAVPCVPLDSDNDRPLSYFGGSTQSTDPRYSSLESAGHSSHAQSPPHALQPILPPPLHAPYPPQFLSDGSQRSSENPTSHTSYLLPPLHARQRLAWSPAATAQDKIEFYKPRFAATLRE